MKELHHSIKLHHYPNFISKIYCNHLIKKSRSCVFYNTRSVQKGITNKLTSTSTTIYNEDYLFEKVWSYGSEYVLQDCKCPSMINNRMLMLKYEKHQYATKHIDALTPLEIKQYCYEKQHKYTFILYLNDDYEGGELHFDKLHFTLKPKSGDAFIWKNILDEKSGNYYIPNELSSHRSLPIKNGTKYCLVTFFT